MTPSSPADLRSESSGGVLAGMNAVVTGASTGIGRAIALAAARAGADIALSYYVEERLARQTASQVEALGRHAHIARLDLSDPSSVDAFADEIHRALGRVDIWINNAGADILTGANAELGDIRKLDLLLAADLRGTILASWSALGLMRRQQTGGVIINMSWDHALTGMPGRNPEMFAAVKGGVLGFSKSLARSAAPDVRVNILAPGWIDTEFGSGLDPARRRAIAESTPLGRWGTPDDVARAAVFLASRDASFLTGQTLLVGGGQVM